MNKRCFKVLLLITGCFLFVFSFISNADIIVEPTQNKFYMDHRDEFEMLRRSYYANGVDGYISLRKAPGSNDETRRIANGEILFIEFSYESNGELWGIARINTLNTAYDKLPAGWISMEDLFVVYDDVSFVEEQGHEFHPYTGGYDELKAITGEIIAWTWPGSGSMQPRRYEASHFNHEESGSQFAYTDEQGREWGSLGHWTGRMDNWVCIDAPTVENIEAFNLPPKPELIPPADANLLQNGMSSIMLILILVAVLVIGTVILIRVFWKPHQETTS